MQLTGRNSTAEELYEVTVPKVNNSIISTLSNADAEMYVSELFSQPRGHKFEEFRRETISNTDSCPELVVAGCSYTYGNGVNLGESWGDILANRLSVSSINISSPGWSTVDIVDNIFNYIHQNGNPKYIAILNTELIRGRDALDWMNTTSGSLGYDNFTRPQIGTVTTHSRLRRGEVAKYSKKPHHVEDVTPDDSYIYRALTHLWHLIMYCKATDILLVWGTWDEESSDLYKYVVNNRNLDHINLGNYVTLPTYENFKVVDFPIDISGFDCSNHGDLYNRGLDSGMHAGSHYHYHWADAFYKRITSIIEEKEKGTSI